MINFFKKITVDTLALLFTARDAFLNWRKGSAVIGIIGAADGPTTILTTSCPLLRKKDRIILAVGVLAILLAKIAFLVATCHKKNQNCRCRD